MLEIKNMSYDILCKAKNLKFIIPTTIIIVLISVTKIRKNIIRKRKRKEWNEAPENTAVLHTFPAGIVCPNLSPFVLKLETYFRATGIQYINDSDMAYNGSPKHKYPWITINGIDMTDSQLIMERLGTQLNKCLNSKLNKEEKAIARSILIMTDEHLYWGLLWWRYVADKDLQFFDLINFFPSSMKLLKPFINKRMSKALYEQGLGRHNSEDILDIMYKDLQAISDFLGTKKYIMGDELTEVDCAVFGLLSQFVWCAPGSPFETWMKVDFKALNDYVLRIKEEYWPDWNKCLNPPN